MVYVPQGTGKVVVKKMREDGAEVIVGGKDYAECSLACEKRAIAHGGILVPAYGKFPLLPTHSDTTLCD